MKIPTKGIEENLRKLQIKILNMDGKVIFIHGYDVPKEVIRRFTSYIDASVYVISSFETDISLISSGEYVTIKKMHIPIMETNNNEVEIFFPDGRLSIIVDDYKSTMDTVYDILQNKKTLFIVDFLKYFEKERDYIRTSIIPSRLSSYNIPLSISKLRNGEIYMLPIDKLAIVKNDDIVYLVDDWEKAISGEVVIAAENLLEKMVMLI